MPNNDQYSGVCWCTGRIIHRCTQLVLMTNSYLLFPDASTTDLRQQHSPVGKKKKSSLDTEGKPEITQPLIQTKYTSVSQH